MMPEMDGFELCRRVKADLQYSHIPVLLLTAKTDVASKVEGLGTGADIYVEKPFSLEYLRPAYPRSYRTGSWYADISSNRHLQNRRR